MGSKINLIIRIETGMEIKNTIGDSVIQSKACLERV